MAFEGSTLGLAGWKKALEARKRFRVLGGTKSYNLNSLKGGYIGDYIGDYYRSYSGGYRSLDYGPSGFEGLF